MLTKSLIVAGHVLVVAWTLPVSAQSNRPDNQNSPSVIDPKACAPGERLEQNPRGSGPPATTGQRENPSEKLSRDEGVLCPPNVDPDIKAPTPDVGNTPVIPPPGSPGGDPSVRPK